MRKGGSLSGRISQLNYPNKSALLVVSFVRPFYDSRVVGCVICTSCLRLTCYVGALLALVDCDVHHTEVGTKDPPMVLCLQTCQNNFL